MVICHLSFNNLSMFLSSLVKKKKYAEACSLIKRTLQSITIGNFPYYAYSTLKQNTYMFYIPVSAYLFFFPLALQPAEIRFLIL